MNKNNIFYYCLAVFFLTSCAEEVVDNKSKVRIPICVDAVNSTNFTRANTDIQSSTFESGELINAYITATGASDGTETIANPALFKTAAAEGGINDLSLNDGSILYYPPGDNVKVNMYALYPSSVLASTTTFNVEANQTESQKYKNSDLMFANASNQAKSKQPIHLQFEHKMAKLIVNASGDEGLKIKKITLKEVNTTVAFTPSSGLLGATSAEKDIILTESSTYVNSLSASAVFPPQTKDNTHFLEILCQNGSTEATAYFYVITKSFEGGKVYTVNIIIGPKNLAEDGIVTIDTWPASVGTISVAPVGSLGLSITNFTDDNDTNTNTMIGSGLTSYYNYNGKECKPIPTVTDGKESGATTLTPEVHYTVDYYNNIDAGTALVVVRGKGTYEGLTAFETFTIKQIECPLQYKDDSKSVNLSKYAVVDNPIINNGVGNKGKAQFTYVSTDPTVASVDGNGVVKMLKKGTTTIKATLDNNGNYISKTISYTLNISAGDAATAMLVTLTDGDSYTYTGNEIKPAINVSDNGNSLAAGTDYTVTYGTGDNQINVCTAADKKAYIKITGINEYSGEKYVYFNITQATNAFTTLNSPTLPIDCGASATVPMGSTTQALSLPAGTFNISGAAKFGSVKYSTQSSSIANVDDSGKITGVGAGTTKIIASVTGTTNYTGLSQEISVTVEKMSFIYVYNGTTGGTASTSSNQYQIAGGSAQTCNFTLSRAATVTIEMIGAGGGNDNKGRGGYGGHVKASKSYAAGDVTFYVYCGGGGQSDATGTKNGTATTNGSGGGGWNGGGHAGSTGASGGGGGATVVATNNTGSSSWNGGSGDGRILVAGGGGGASNGNYGGGDGGASDAGDNTGNWVGQDKSIHTNDSGGYLDGGGGGAGYIGGVYGYDNQAGGHGGSNHIASGWESITNGVSTWGHVPNASAASYSDENHKLYPGYVFITYTY